MYARGEVNFAKLVCQTVVGPFFLFCQIIWMPRATPTVHHPKLLLLFFFAKTEKPSPTIFHLRLPFIPSWEKPPPRAHPPVFEEVEAYKNYFVFPRIPDL
jgi:hypothetical protein